MTSKLDNLMNLSGRRAMITGASGHLGQTMCETLAKLGADVILLDLRENGLTEIADRLAADFGAKVEIRVVDLEDEEQIVSFCSDLKKDGRPLDILVNNAAFVGTSNLDGWIGPFEEQSSEAWRRALEVNLTSNFILVQQCQSMLEASGHGSIINVASIYGIVGPDTGLYAGTKMGNPAAYAVSKGGLIQFTRWLSTVLAPKIRVNAISPGGVFRNQDAAFINRYEARTPLKRMATEEDFRGVTAFLASDMSAYITGQNIVVDGGWSVW